MKFSPQLMRGCGFLVLSCSLLAQSPEQAEQSHHAKDLMSAGKFEEAVPIYRELVRAMPNNPGFIVDLGLALDMAGNKREAVREFEAALKLDPRQLPALLFLGSAYLEMGEPTKAVEPVEKALKLQPDNVDAQELSAEAYLALGKNEQAAKQFEKVCQSDAQNPKAWYGLGLSYEGLAQNNFDQLQKVAPDSAYWLDLVGESRLKILQYSSAFFFYRQALAKAPPLRGIHAALAQIYRNTGHAEWAATEEQKERQLSPPDCGVQNPECDYQAGHFAEVVAETATFNTPEGFYWRTRAFNQLLLQAFARLGELPPSTELHELMAKIKYDRRQYHESAGEWRAALELSPGNLYIREQLALALIRNKDLDGARQVLEGLVKQEPSSAEVNYMLGDTLLNLQKPEEAISFLKKAVAVKANFLEAHDSLARAYLQIHDYQKAVPHLKAALPIDQDGSMHYQLARAYQQSGQTELAKVTLREYQKIAKSVAEEKQATSKDVEILPPE